MYFNNKYYRHNYTKLINLSFFLFFLVWFLENDLVSECANEITTVKAPLGSEYIGSYHIVDQTCIVNTLIGCYITPKGTLRGTMSMTLSHR